MNIKILLGFFLIVIFALSIYLIGLFYTHYKTNIKIEYPTSNISIPDKNKSLSDQDDSWLKDSLKNSKSYAYPATEIKISMDFKSPDDKSIPTKLIVDNLDEYKFFCLNEVLKEEKIEFAYYQAKNSTNIVIFLPSDKRRDKIMEDLKYYEIQYKLQ
ncbi:hypothetical protein [Helicobacter cappadocius]|uniref:Periplasmic protein n=1 Tax=Helicobacter cappadocius TaxID=3063998 RepID=A0AA90PJ99_9HELI|nr:MULTISPECIES: hypothetical protein [unclassified Helicobacter]MDO7252678.1 hypothetical protein [Helicobacter sp. faydin-H75]MDP2538545.1 hypothetical protein [Helicobacter sp. faydin-H76]